MKRSLIFKFSWQSTLCYMIKQQLQLKTLKFVLNNALDSDVSIFQQFSVFSKQNRRE